MKTPNHLLYFGLIFLFVLSLVVVPRENVHAAGTISLAVMGSTYTQNFDTLATTGTTNNIDDLNNGWYLTETPAGANGQYAANNGSNNAGDTYSYGATGSTERALGGLQTGALTPLFGASFTNTTGATINGLAITYTGEEWRLGTAGRTDRLDFEYSTNATSLDTGIWTGVAALNFLTPDIIAPVGQRNGNAAGERTSLSALITGLSIANGATFWIRWTDINVSGSDDGLAVDDFSLTPSSTSTITTIKSDSPDPSVYGQAVTVSFDVTSTWTGTPTGSVTVTDGTDSCTGALAAGSGSCLLTLTTAGSRTLTATYAGDLTFQGSTSAGEPHTVNQANTTTTITSDDPDPSQVGQPVTVNFTVAALAPGAGTPTGNVTVSDGTASCTGTVAIGFCNIVFTSLGPKTITASYAGDGNFNPSTSGTQAHTVTAASTTIAITSHAPDPSVVGVPVPVTYTVTVIGPGGGTPTGTVTVTDGVDNCTGTVAAGTCNLIMTTTGGRLLTASYSGDANYGGSVSIPPQGHWVQGPPAVTLINSSANTGDGQVVENELTSVAITQLLVVFNKDMNADIPVDLNDALNVANYSLVRGGSTVIPINGVITYNAGTRTATLDVNGGVALADGVYTLTILGRIEDTLGVPIGTNFVRHFSVDSGHPYHTSIVTIPGNSAITNGATVNVSFSSIDIAFDEDLYNPAGDIDPDDVTNAENYLLVTPGSDGMFQTSSCTAGIAGDDVALPIGPITYTNHGGSGPFVATAQLNGGASLPNGLYRLLICGTTSITDLAGNSLNGDAGPDSQVNFTVRVLSNGARNPKTGFAPGVVTVLPDQPANKAYTNLGDLWIEISKLNLKTSITGVPLTVDGWDVTWLNRQVGWLAGTAYPTWEGNTVLTAHGYTADGEPGPFALLKNLSYGETIIIHLGGMKYTYAVRTNALISPTNTYWLTKHEKLDWITLITCQQYDEKTKSYLYRRVVRAVLISVEEE